MTVDACASHGIAVPGLSESKQEEIRKNLNSSARAIAALSNPIDLTGSGVDEDFVTTARTLLAMDDIDSIIVLLLPYIPGITSDLGAKLSLIAREYENR